MTNLRLALAQENPTVGALTPNTKKIIETLEKARKTGAHLVAFPELVISGYPAEDLLFKPAFITACRQHLDEIIKASSDLVVIVGFPEQSDKLLYNSAAIIADQHLITTYRKQHLPNYGVFDEARYFTPSMQNKVFSWNGVRFGVTICEDIWIENGPHRKQAMDGGAKLLLNISSSPYHRGKQKFREEMLSKRASENSAFVAYCNLVGGQDELVFDGGSPVIGPSGQILARGKQFKEDLVLFDLSIEERTDFQPSKGIEEIHIPFRMNDSKLPSFPPHLHPPLDSLDEIYQALVLGTRDYVMKNGFKSVVMGLSGGIDSSLTACIAVDALGASNVTGVLLPSQYSSEHSKNDAGELAQTLGIRTLTIPIEPIYNTFTKALAPAFADKPQDVTEENLQSRIRGALLMALSNKFSWLVLTTANKSEVSVGYTTLYGDMVGGFAVIKDVPKTLIYQLARHRNKVKSVIPENVFSKPPSAELRPNQKDTDSLPEYEVLDPILEQYIEHNANFDQIAAKGFSLETVRKVIRMVDRAEYKRRQGAPGIKITERALGKDWRLPLTNHFIEEAQP